MCSGFPADPVRKLGRVPEYRNNHLTTVAYLTNWCAADGKLRVRRVRNGSSAVAAPRSVAYEKAWWSINRALNAAAEKACSRLESLAPPLLRPRSNWPYEGPDRATLSEFMALHILRTRAWRRWYETARETSLDQRAEGWDAGDDLLEQFVRNARSDEETLKSFERILGSVTGLLASMHWTLIAFDEPILVTSDQPVAPMPLPTSSGMAEFAAMPRGGLLDTLEIRFALGPANGLVLSWAQGPDRAIRGCWSHATTSIAPSSARPSTSTSRTRITWRRCPTNRCRGANRWQPSFFPITASRAPRTRRIVSASDRRSRS